MRKKIKELYKDSIVEISLIKEDDYYHFILENKYGEILEQSFGRLLARYGYKEQEAREIFKIAFGDENGMEDYYKA